MPAVPSPGAPQHPQRITFRVEGMAPAPQGSKKPLGKDRLGRTVLVESCKRVKPWRQMVTEAALATGAPILTGPVVLRCEFLFLRPLGHFRRDGTLKPSAPRWHAVRPDGSKLLRSSEDALSQVLIHDDARIVTTIGHKRWCRGDERPGALFTLFTLPT